VISVLEERLKILRKERNLTQREVFSAVGLSERNYQSFEYGEIRPSYDSLIALAGFFNVSLDYLVGRTDKPEVNR